VPQGASHTRLGHSPLPRARQNADVSCVNSIGQIVLDTVAKKKTCTLPIAILELQTLVVEEKMSGPKLTRLELQIMEALWTQGKTSIREIQETFPEKNRPAYTTIQTTVYRLEGKKAIRRVKKVGNFHIFEAMVSRSAAQQRLVDELLALFGGRTRPVVAHLTESGKLTLEDIKEAEKILRKLERKDKSK
jgi:BlaI family penicillinase repressor